MPNYGLRIFSSPQLAKLSRKSYLIQHSNTRLMMINRESIAAIYLTGQGIEIGACDKPLKVLPGVVVKYVDCLPSAEELKKQYPSHQDYVHVDIVDNGETLATIPDVSQDFVIASHVIEHCEDPINAIQNWIRVLKPGGILYMIIPDKRYIFDKDRPITPLWHIKFEHKFGTNWLRGWHYREFAFFKDKKKGRELKEYASALERDAISIHFHVWTQAEMMELLGYLKKRLPFEVEMFARFGVECICVLRRI